MRRNIAKLKASMNHEVYACDFELNTLNCVDHSHTAAPNVSSAQQVRYS